MGYYINTTNDKQEFLELNGERVSSFRLPKYSDIPETKALVCLVDNGMFTAAGIIFSQRELNDWTDSSDSRSKSWFLIDRKKLYSVSDITPERFEQSTSVTV